MTTKYTALKLTSYYDYYVCISPIFLSLFRSIITFVCEVRPKKHKSQFTMCCVPIAAQP